MKVPVWHLIKSSYRDACRFAQTMPKLALALLAASSFVAIPAVTLAHTSSWQAEAITVALGVAASVLATPVLIAIHRFVLLGEKTGRYEVAFGSPRFRLFLGYVLFFVLIGELSYVFEILVGERMGEWAILLHLVGLAILVVVFVRLALVFPAIALDAPNKGWGAAVRDSHGRSWQMFLILLLVFLPGLAALVAWGVMEGYWTLDGWIGSGTWTVVDWLIWTLLETCITLLLHTTVAHLYLNFARTLWAGHGMVAGMV